MYWCVLYIVIYYNYVLECGLVEIPLTEDVVGKIGPPSAATRVGMSVADRVSVLMQFNGITLKQNQYIALQFVYKLCSLLPHLV